jgi:putative nucleotidyltransferase with HDIG domain
VVFRGASAIPKQLAERTECIVDRVEQSDQGYGAMSMISALTAAIDAKDHYTFAHSKNVARYAANLAVAAGLNEEQVRTIYAAGLLHDIGKISIPEDILNKTGKLTDEEYGIMKNHVNSSIEMIRHLPEMDYLVPAALGHHERWDGRGYPRGISGEDIPVSARCLAIADVFDAMTTDRPYRKGLSPEYALEQIRQGAGTQFDPHLAIVFVRLVTGHEIPLAGRLAEK